MHIKTMRAPGRAGPFCATMLAVALAVAPAAAADDAKPLTSAPAQPALAVSGGFGTWEDLFDMQDRLNAIAGQIVAVSDGSYAGIVAAPEDRALVVYWKGPVPASVRALVAGSGVPVRFRPARFTHHQLVREAQRLAADPRVAAIGPAADGSGLTVTLADTVPPVNTSQANNGLLATSTVPLTVRSGPRLQLLFSRDNDTSAYWGGGQTRNAVTGGGCSTGFAIWWNDARRMLTAAHCGINGQLVRDGGGVAGTDDMGPIINDVDSRDHQMIDRLPTKSYAGRIFTGPWSASTSIGVGGAGTDFVGNIICTGGSYSGEHCNTAPNQPPSRVTAVDQTATISGITISPLTVAVSTVVGGCIAAPGDSGGPVYTPRNDFRVDARGTITAGFLNVLCPNVFPGGPRIGTDQLWYAPVLRPAGGPTTGSLTYYDASPILG